MAKSRVILVKTRTVKRDTLKSVKTKRGTRKSAKSKDDTPKSPAHRERMMRIQKTRGYFLEKDHKLLLNMPDITLELEVYMRNRYGINLAHSYGVGLRSGESSLMRSKQETMINFLSDNKIIGFFEEKAKEEDDKCKRSPVRDHNISDVKKRLFNKIFVEIPRQLLGSVSMIIPDNPNKGTSKCLIFDSYHILHGIRSYIDDFGTRDETFDFLSHVAKMIRSYSGKHQIQYWCNSGKRRDDWYSELIKHDSNALNLRTNMKPCISIKPRNDLHDNYGIDDEFVMLHEKIIQHIRANDKKFYKKLKEQQEITLMPWFRYPIRIGNMKEIASKIAKNLENIELIIAVYNLNAEFDKNGLKPKLIYKQREKDIVYDVTIGLIPAFLYGSIVIKFIGETFYDQYYGQLYNVTRMYMSYDPATILETLIRFCTHHKISVVTGHNDTFLKMFDELIDFLSDKPVLF